MFGYKPQQVSFWENFSRGDALWGGYNICKSLIRGFTQCEGDKTHRGQEAGVSNTVVRTGCRGQNMVEKLEPQGKSRNLSVSVY